MKSSLISEVRKLQKIAGLLKEDTFDLSDTPEFSSEKKVFRGEDYVRLRDRESLSRFDKWVVDLFELIMKEAKLGPEEIAISGLRDFYKQGKTPEEVYFDEWKQDAGNFWAF